MDRLLNSRQAAELLGVSPACFYKYGWDQAVPHFYTLGGTHKRGHWRGYQSVVLRFKDSLTRPQEDKQPAPHAVQVARANKPLPNQTRFKFCRLEDCPSPESV